MNPIDEKKDAKISRIAVVAVHGVGPHVPGATAKAVADLLPNFFPSVYGPCLQTHLRVNTEKIEITQHSQTSTPTSPFDQRGSAIRALQENLDEPQTEATLPFDYMADQLRELELPSKDRIYDSIRLETQRNEGGVGPDAELHIHELHWSDISHPGTGVFRGIIELYRLLFDLCSLGRHSLDAATASRPSDITWQRFRQIQGFAEWCLVQAVPISNLCVLLVTTVFLILAVPKPYLFWICTALPAIFLGGSVALGFSIAASRSFHQRWLVRLPATLTAIGLGWWLASVGFSFFQAPARMAALAWWPIPLGGFLWLMRIYDERRPGAFFISLIASLGTTILFVCQVFTVCLPQPADAGHLLDAALRTIEGTFLLMTFAWLGLWLALFLMTIVGFIAMLQAKKCTPNERQKLSRAAWTAQLTIFLPALMVVVCNVSLWSAVSSVAIKSIAGQTPKEMPFNHRPLYADVSDTYASNFFKAVSVDLDAKTRYVPAKNAAEQLAKDGGKFMPRGVLILLVGLVIAIWSLAPAVWNERWPTSNSPRAAKWLGQTLTDGFFALRGAGEWIRWAVISTTLITVAYTWCWSSNPLNFRPFPFEEKWIAGAQAVLAGIVFALVASSGPFKFLALGFRVVLDVGIDVINWLRVHPLKSNPKARIAARFGSLLRYITDERQGYEALIIVAHSQGTVISADVLRFLKHQNQNGSVQFTSLFDGHMPIYFFTMGSPLRQLYSLRFPHLYGWARGEFNARDSKDHAMPLPTDLGVVHWSNAFSSGDYVGRCLWHSENDSNTWTIDRKDSSLAGHKSEFCIGTGAHMHYWDGTSPLVAAELHSLVTEAVALAKSKLK